MELEAVSFPSPWTLATYHSELTRNSRSRYLKVGPAPGPGVRAAGAAVPALIAQGGFMLFGAEMHIVTIAVQPAWRGRSIGEWLLLALLALGREEGAHTATLEVRVSNEIALRLYRRAGFRRRSGIGGATTRTRRTRASWRWRSCTGRVCGSRCGSGSKDLHSLSALMGRGVEAPG